jgi:hypothetical protein
MQDPFSINYIDLADIPIYKRLQNDRDLIVSVEFAAIEQDIDDVNIKRALNNDDHHLW